MTKNIVYTYDIYIGAPVSKVWKGLVDGDITKQYVFGTRFVGPLKKGAPYAYVGDGDFTVVDGEILEIEPEKWLAMSWKAHWDASVAKDRASRVIYEKCRRQAGGMLRQQYGSELRRHLCGPRVGSLESGRCWPTERFSDEPELGWQTSTGHGGFSWHRIGNRRGVGA
jgi:uncharacterized protein YndB with AHSA1/START domain